MRNLRGRNFEGREGRMENDSGHCKETGQDAVISLFKEIHR